MMRKLLFPVLAILTLLSPFAGLAILTLLSPASAQQGVPFIPADSVSKRIAVEAGATGTTAAVAATLPAVVGHTNYVCGISVSPGSAATAITINVVLSGIPNSMTWAVGAPVTAVGVTGAVLTVPFTPCQAASAVNTAITVTSGALGTSGVNNDANIWGFSVEGP